MRCIDADALEKEGWSLHRDIQVDKNTREYQTKPLRQVPTIEPEQRWIPCSERLPDKPNVYTVTDHNGRVVRYVYNDNESSREYWKRCAKAWMPLPEPYAERRTDDKTNKGSSC